MPLLFPRCRPVIATPLCPLNWALLIFFLQLILLPLVVIFVGPTAGTLPALPSDFATNISLFLSTLAYVAFCAAYHCFAARPASTLATERTIRRWTPPTEMIALYAVIGLVGLLLNFGKPARLPHLFHQRGTTGIAGGPGCGDPATLRAVPRRDRSDRQRLSDRGLPPRCARPARGRAVSPPLRRAVDRAEGR